MATPGAVRSFEYWAAQYRKTWRGSITASFLNPVLFLLAMGLGLGSLIDHSHRAASLGGHQYVVFLAPGLLAGTAMQIAGTESTYPVMASVRWVRQYHAMLATPLRVIDVLLGHLLYIAARLALASAIFVPVTAAFGATRSWAALLDVPAAVLTGMAFAAPITAWAVTAEHDGAFAPVFRFVLIPMFLFSGTFFPVSQLPAGIRPLAYLTPLWHGVDLCRSLALGTATPLRTLLHVSVLSGLMVAGAAAGAVTYRRRLAG
jgi:lipooligosaccharide transport system permease protein